MNREQTKFYIHESYSSPPRKNYETNKIVYNHFDEIWSIYLADFSDYKTSSNRGFRYIFVIIDISGKYLWGIPLKKTNSQTITQEFSNILTTSKRSPIKLEANRRAEFYNSIFQNFLKSEIIQHYSTFAVKGPSVVERVIRTVRILSKKPVFGKVNTDWLSELQSVIKKYNKTIHSSKK